MKEQKISIVSLIITGVALVALTAWLIHEHHHLSHFVPTPPPAGIQSNTIAPPTDTADGTNQSVCYYLNQPSKGGSGADVAYLKLTVNGSTMVAGELGIELAEKDTMSGTLNGVISNDPATNGSGYIFDGQYANEGEGVKNVDEQLIKFDSTQAQIGYGDMTREVDGSYGYKDKSAVTYSLTIPRVDCGQYDSLTEVMQD